MNKLDAMQLKEKQSTTDVCFFLYITEFPIMFHIFNLINCFLNVEIIVEFILIFGKCLIEETLV